VRQQSLEQTIIDKINSAKVATQEKLFKQFVKSLTDEERNKIGAKMNVLDSVVFDLIKAIRGKIE
jgi:hypothetical protein